MQAAGITEAHTLVIATSDDALNLSIMMQARVLNPQIRIINRFYNTNLGERLDQTLSNHLTLSVVGLAAPVFTFAALGTKQLAKLNYFSKLGQFKKNIFTKIILGKVKKSANYGKIRRGCSFIMSLYKGK